MRWQSARSVQSQLRLAHRLELVVFAQLTLASSFLVLGWCNFLVGLVGGPEYRIGLLELADEQMALLNIYQPIGLMIAGTVSFCCAIYSPRRRAFIGLGIAFGVLAFIETGALDSHSIYIHRTISMFGTETGSVAALLLVPLAAGVALTPALKALPAKRAFQFILCGALYSTGVLGLQIVSHEIALAVGVADYRYILASGLEETLETIAIVGFCGSAAGYFRDLAGKLPRISPTPF